MSSHNIYSSECITSRLDKLNKSNESNKLKLNNSDIEQIIKSCKINKKIMDEETGQKMEIEMDIKKNNSFHLYLNKLKFYVKKYFNIILLSFTLLFIIFMNKDKN